MLASACENDGNDIDVNYSNWRMRTPSRVSACVAIEGLTPLKSGRRISGRFTHGGCPALPAQRYLSLAPGVPFKADSRFASRSRSLEWSQSRPPLHSRARTKSEDGLFKSSRHDGARLLWALVGNARFRDAPAQRYPIFRYVRKDSTACG